MKLFCQNPLNGKSPFEVEVDYFIKRNKLTAKFQASSNLENWNHSPLFSKNYYKNWRLWDYDVFEIFLQFRKEKEQESAPYIELQVSPLNQKFALITYRPRDLYFTPFESFFTTTSTFKKSQWKASFEVNLDKIPKISKEEYLYFGIFAALGTEKQFFTHHKEKLNPIDFHQPRYFKKNKND